MVAQSTSEDQEQARSGARADQQATLPAGLMNGADRGAPAISGSSNLGDHSQAAAVQHGGEGAGEPRTAREERGRQAESSYGTMTTSISGPMVNDLDRPAGGEGSAGRAVQPVEAESAGTRTGVQNNVQDDESTVDSAHPLQQSEFVPPQQPVTASTQDVPAERDPGSAGFVTPRSMRTAWAEYQQHLHVGQPSSRGPGDVEQWPRWVQRLSDMFRPPQVPTAWLPSHLPSPLSDVRSRPGGGDGGVDVRVTRPGVAQAAPSPPSSSSLPAEAIQAEVQRQLGGLLERVQKAEAENARLLRKLEQRTGAADDLEAPVANALQGPTVPLAASVSQGPTVPLAASVSQGPTVPRAASASQGPTVPRAASVSQGPPVPRVASVPQGSAAAGAEYEPQRAAGFYARGNSPGGPSVPKEGGRRDLLGSLWGEISGRLGAHRDPTAERAGPGLEGNQPQYHGAESGGGVFSQSVRAPGAHSTTAVPQPSSSFGRQDPPNLLDAIAKGVQQLQEIQVQSFRREEDNSPEQVKSTCSPLPNLKAPSGDNAGVQLQDWLLLVNTSMQDLSATSGQWWEAVTAEVGATYAKWLAATPLERLQVQPKVESALTSGRWTRINARACSLVLASLDETIKEDLVGKRSTQSMVALLFRLHTVYQPGGPHERARVLQNLQDPQIPDTMAQCLVALRAWPRAMQRCQDMGMMHPDGSVLAKALTSVSSRFIAGNSDAAFRTQLLRSTLRIDGQPTMESVRQYQQHLQAEIENMIAAGVDQGSIRPRIKSLTTPRTPGGGDEQPTTPKNKVPCRFFFKAQGCRRGSKCPYGHDMTTLGKSERSRKCLACGSEDHRQRDCPTTKAVKPGKTGAESDPKSTSMQPTTTTPRAQQVTFEDQAREASQPIQGDPVWTMETLLRAAAQVVQSTPSSTEPKAPSMKVMRIARQDTALLDAEDVYALMDSGATHPLRRAWTEEEWWEADPVVVTLAGGESVSLRMNKGGTLLVPVTGRESTSPIVPLGSLVQQLGYTLEWSVNKCRLVGRGGDVHHLRVRNGCPELMECQALNLIAKLEEENLRTLKTSVEQTKQRVRQAAMSLERTWFDHLIRYCRSERTNDAVQAVGEAPFFEEVPILAKKGLTEGFPEENGWQALRGLRHLNRRTRKRLHESDQWIVHLFAGAKPNEEFRHLEKHGCVLLELDISRGATQDITDPAVWRALEWGARKGKIRAIVGGPPCRTYSMLRYKQPGPSPVRSNAYPYGGWEGQPAAEENLVIKDTGLFVRMIYLHALATAGRAVAQPNPPQDPQEYLPWDHELYDTVVSFWRSELWRGYANEAGLSMYSLEQGALGHPTRKPTTLGTNLNFLSSLDGLQATQSFGTWIGLTHALAEWAPGLVTAIVKAVIVQGRVPRMLAMSVEQWRDHVRRGHLPYRRDCLTCVQAGATGRRHSRSEHPDAFVLTADLSGPLKEPGLDSHGRGRAPAKFRYFFVAKLRIPRSFVDDGRGVGVDFDPAEPPSDDPEGEPADGLTSFGEDEKPPERSLPEEEPLEAVDESQDEFVEISGDDGDGGESGGPSAKAEELSPPEMVNLIFATGLHDNKSATVLEAVQDVVYYAQSYNIPILRFHCDRSMEFFARASRRWIKDQGIRMTCSEGGEHQSNGAAENTVRWVKQRARTLLASAGLHQNLWPHAAHFAATQQRAEVLGFETRAVAPFGSRVLIKKKSYVGAYHGGKLDDLAPRWEEGYYLGLSDAIRGGHLVYIAGEGSRFLHNMHVKHHLHDPGPPDEVVETEAGERPRRRRLREKTRESAVLTSVLQVNPIAAEEELKDEAEQLLQCWNTEKAEDLVMQACAILPSVANKYGLFRHGGVMGLTRASYEHPWMAKVLVKLLQEADPDAEFTSVYLSLDGEKGLHMDSRNEAGTLNYVYPLRLPRRGGDIWLELGNGDVVSNKIVELKDKSGRSHYGCALGLRESELISFNPRRRHAVLPWRGGPGERITVIGYTPARVNKISSTDKEHLTNLGFELPADIVDDSVAIRALRLTSPKIVEDEVTEELCGGGWEERVLTSDGELLFTVDWRLKQVRGHASEPSSSRPSMEVDNQVEEGPEEMSEIYLVLKEGDPPQLVMMDASAATAGEKMKLLKAEVNYTRGIEDLLAALTEPIAVVHTVHPGEAATHLERWIPSIQKELTAIQHAVVRLPKGSAQREEWLSRPGVQLLPMKLVFTIKPPDVSPGDNQGPLYKRKARAVICGNLADASDLEVYTGAAPAEVVRAALAIASRYGWLAAVLDIISAFLQTRLDEVPQAPVVVAIPPKSLVRAQLAEEEELWGITHAVYGLRESPRLWGFFRDGQMQRLKIVLEDKEISLVQGRIEPTWWSIQVEGNPTGILVIYVDDYLILGPPEIIKAVATAVQGLWRTSPLQFAERDNPVRFLGMDVYVTRHGFAVSQRSYIQELLRVHSVDERRLDVVPVNRELALFEAQPEESSFTQQELRFAQQCAGEILWVSQRSRPDLGFTASLLSSLTTRAPRRVAEVAAKVHGYLQRTMDHCLYLEADETELVGYADSSFAPSGERSHTGWVIMLYGVPVSWRSSRQPTTSLSTGEAELTAATEGALALLSTQALLQDVLPDLLNMQLESDSTTALALVEGSGSWRTRHLRIKANWLYEKLKAGQITMSHCQGISQPADILTKAMPSPRMLQLMELWNIRVSQRELEDDANESSSSTSPAFGTAPGVSRVLLALMILAQSVSQGSTMSVYDSELVPYEPLRVDSNLAAWLFFWGMVLIMIVVWELLKWLGWQAFFNFGAGASERRMRRLQRLRDATAQAITDEFQRLAREPETEPLPVVTTGASSTSTRRREVTERASQTAAPAFVRPEPVPPPVVIRYEAEPAEQVYAVPGRPTYHIYPRCHAFRHAGTLARVEHLRLCGFCRNHEGRNPLDQDG